MVQLSGAAELLGGIGLLIPATRTFAGLALIVFLVAVFPANIEMLRQAYIFKAPRTWQCILWLRLPLQGLIIWWVSRVSRRKDKPKTLERL